MEKITKITSKDLKKLLIDIVCFTGEVDTAGVKVTRKTMPAHLYKSFKSIRDQIISTMEYGFVSKEETRPTVDISEVIWMSTTSDPESYKDLKIIAERHTEEPIEINLNDINVIKHFYFERYKLSHDLKDDDFDKDEEIFHEDVHQVVGHLEFDDKVISDFIELLS